jgi:hypothetical protein
MDGSSWSLRVVHASRTRLLVNRSGGPVFGKEQRWHCSTRTSCLYFSNVALVTKSHSSVLPHHFDFAAFVDYLAKNLKYTYLSMYICVTAVRIYLRPEGKEQGIREYEARCFSNASEPEIEFLDTRPCIVLM